MKSKIKEKFSVTLASKPSLVVILGICVFNVLLIIASAFIISSFAITGSEHMSMFEAAYYSFTMILDAGCVQGVVSEIGRTNVAIVILCACIGIIGMISFTGSVIGYVASSISSFIENANEGQHKIYAKNHMVIINWNSKGGEIVNDLLYKDGKSLVVVLTENNKEEIKKEIDESLTRIIEKAYRKAKIASKDMSFIKRMIYLKKNDLRNKVTVIIRQGDIFSSKQLLNVSLEKAGSIVILDNDSRFNEESSSVVLKILMQVADICNKEDSNENQRIVVESNSKWTSQMIKKISSYKTNGEKSKVIILPVNKILGNILSQLTFMADLSIVYNKLFSYDGIDFHTKEVNCENESKYIEDYMLSHNKSIPLGFIDNNNQRHFVTVSDGVDNLVNTTTSNYKEVDYKLNKKFKHKKRNIIILGHDSNCEGILNGFKEISDKFYGLRDKKSLIDITIIDDKKSLQKTNTFIKKYPFVKKVVCAEIEEKDKISKAINECIDKNNDTNILILSDDKVSRKDLDANVLTNLIYVQDIIKERKEKGLDVSMIDVIVEIIDSNNYDIINNYSINKVAISNKYVSKLIAQISDNEVLYDFFKDILLYNDGTLREGKEIYVKNVAFFFSEIPSKCKAKDLLVSIYEKTKETNPTILLGYITKDDKAVFLNGNLDEIELDLKPEDKLILYCEE